LPHINDVRSTLCRFAHLLHTQGLVAGLDGNVSARLDDGTFLATPTASHLGVIEPHDLLIVTLDGEVQGDGRVTSEWAMHAACYRNRPDVGAVFHAHPVHVVARTLDGREMDPAVLPEVLVCVGPAPLVPYATTGTSTLAHAVGEAIRNANAAILERHGAVTVGRTIQQACARMEALEHAAKIFDATVRPPTPLPADEQARLAVIRDQLGNI
jgi:L-fuculose-phosphate aldolase